MASALWYLVDGIAIGCGFINDPDVECSEDLFAKLNEDHAIEITTRLWQRPIDKKVVSGIHGTLFYQLLGKKVFYPTKREAEMVPLGTDRL